MCPNTFKLWFCLCLHFGNQFKRGKYWFFFLLISNTPSFFIHLPFLIFIINWSEELNIYNLTIFFSSCNPKGKLWKNLPKFSICSSSCDMFFIPLVFDYSLGLGFAFSWNGFWLLQVTSTMSLRDGRKVRFCNRRCYCGRKAEVMISDSVDNPHRLFFHCRLKFCGFFEW